MPKILLNLKFRGTDLKFGGTKSATKRNLLGMASRIKAYVHTSLFIFKCKHFALQNILRRFLFFKFRRFALPKTCLLFSVFEKKHRFWPDILS